MWGIGLTCGNWRDREKVEADFGRDAGPFVAYFVAFQTMAVDLVVLVAEIVVDGRQQAAVVRPEPRLPTGPA